jgi:CheY-like chemotaxis protein
LITMRIKVLICDDDPVAIFLHKFHVVKSQLDLSPLLFTKPNEVQAHLTNHLDPDVVHLLLLDINMPEMSGWDLLNHLAEYGPGRTYAIIVSSSVNKKDYEKARSYEQVVGYIEKPLNANKLSEQMEGERLKQLLGKNAFEK